MQAYIAAMEASNTVMQTYNATMQIHSPRNADLHGHDGNLEQLSRMVRANEIVVRSSPHAGPNSDFCSGEFSGRFRFDGDVPFALSDATDCAQFRACLLGDAGRAPVGPQGKTVATRNRRAEQSHREQTTPELLTTFQQGFL